MTKIEWADLKPCCCGAMPTRRARHLPLRRIYGICVWVECEDCGKCTSSYYTNVGNEHAANAEWNELYNLRAENERLRARVDVLEDVCSK